MGDRGNIVVIDRREVGGQKVVGYTFLYTHWSGSAIEDMLRTALSRRERWDDGSYLTRIIFSEMIKGYEVGETGFGISPFMGDNSYPILLVDPSMQMIRCYQESEIEAAALEHREPGRSLISWKFETFVNRKGKRAEA